MMNLLKKTAPYLFIFIVTILTFFYVYRSYGFNLDIPYSYQGDAIWNIAGVKGFIENGKFIENINTGAPFGTNYYDYPGSESLYKIFIFVLIFFVKNPVVVLNLYYLLTFILTAIISYIVLKYFKISTNLCIFAALIITFLPYHIKENIGHISLASYYLIPLTVLVLHWIFTNQFSIKNNFREISLSKFIKSKIFLSFIIMILVANNGIYYSFFTITFLILAGIIASIEYKDIKNLFYSFLFTAIIVVTILINVSPNIIHQFKYGRNPNIAHRYYNEPEYYGLKIIELFIPVTNFGNDYVRKFKERYTNFTLTKSERSSYLGIIGSIGFILLILNLFSKKSFDKKIDYLSYLTLWALLLSVATGIGTIVGYLISSQIRVYARISIFINIFAVFALVFLLDKIIKKNNKRKILINTFLIIVYVFAILDQTKPDEINAKGLYYSDKSFVEKIEKSGSGSMIFQLPYKSFPESVPVNRLIDYDLFRPYIHSKNLKWSYGIIKGTPQDQWIKTISSLPADQIVEKTTLAGYGGIYIDTTGYIDGGKELENNLSRILLEKPIKSNLNDLIFFNLKNYQQKLIDQYGKKEMGDKKKQILTLPILVEWNKGFYQEETNNVNSWHWSSNISSITLVNDNPEDKNIVLKFSVTANYPEYSNLKISSKSFTKNIKINRTIINFEKKIKLSQRKYQINFDTDSKKVIAPNDPRDLYFRIYNLRVEYQ